MDGVISFESPKRAPKSSKAWFANTFRFVAACSITKVLEHISTVFASVVQMMDTIIVFNHIKIGNPVERFGSSKLEILFIEFAFTYHKQQYLYYNFWFYSIIKYGAFALRKFIFLWHIIFIWLEPNYLNFFNFNIFYNFSQVTQQNYPLNCNFHDSTLSFFCGFLFSI